MEIKLVDVKKEIENLPSDIFGINEKIKVKNIKFLKTNRKNLNIYFKISKKEFIFRINIKGLNNNSYKKSKKEYNKLKIVEKYNLSDTKKIYFSKKGKFCPYSYIIITYIKGKNIVLNKKNISIIAKKLAKSNNVKLSFLEKIKIDKQNYNKLMSEFKIKEAYISHRYLEISKIYKKIRKNIERNKPNDINKDNYLTHGDLNSKNIIENKHKINFIDWEYLKIGNPILDIAKLSHSNKFKSFEKLFLKEYIKNFKKIKNVSKKYFFFKDLQVYFWLVTSSEYYFHLIFEETKYNLYDRKKIIKDILKNYKYLYDKGYTDKKIEHFRKILKI